MDHRTHDAKRAAQVRPSSYYLERLLSEAVETNERLAELATFLGVPGDSDHVPGTLLRLSTEAGDG